MTTKHTPGPWTIQGFEETPEDEFGQPLDGTTIESDDTSICGIAGALPLSEFAANAQLIAAAPDLLEALENVLLWLQDDDCSDIGVAIAAQQAIAEAKGE